MIETMITNLPFKKTQAFKNHVNWKNIFFFVKLLLY